ncbi:MAG: diguanylate cyclase [Burkholderiales bacterium]|nr:diguanylate cyclase [Burkholderiales bacterium]MBK9348617.1 diguanylate cyclase [Burkholderiales bacterium]
MPSVLVHLLLTVLLLWASPGWANGTSANDAIVLNGNAPSFQIDSPLGTWIDSGSKATITDVVNAPGNFKSTPPLARQPIAIFDTLWIKLRVVRAPDAPAAWTLNIPLPYLDSATLYQADSQGNWRAQSAGDTLAQSQWHTRGLYPDFDIQLPTDAPHDLYLQVRNFTHLNIPIRVASASEREAQRLREMIGQGLMLGALLSMALLSVIRYLEHRNPIDGWSAGYGVMITLTIAQIGGVLNAFFWTHAPEFGNYASSVMPVVAVGCALLFIHSLSSLTAHHAYNAFLSSIGWACVASVLSYAVLDRFVAEWICNVVLLCAVSLGTVITLLSWRGGSLIGRWLIVAMLPQFLGVMYLLAEALGLVPPFWEMRYITSVSVALSVPALIYALSQITHDRKELVVRARHLPTQDALTGLLIPEVFQSHLEQAVQRAIDSREPVGLVVVRVINYDFIRSTYGDATAEHCLLRAVIKLQRVLRDADPAGRVGSADFALLLNGMPSRQALTERMVTLIASGLIPLPNLVPEVTLQFQATCLLLQENPVPADRVISDLQNLLAEMSPRTRRPIRFLEALPTEANLPADSLHEDAPTRPAQPD